MTWAFWWYGPLPSHSKLTFIFQNHALFYHTISSFKFSAFAGSFPGFSFSTFKNSQRQTSHLQRGREWHVVNVMKTSEKIFIKKSLFIVSEIILEKLKVRASSTLMFWFFFHSFLYHVPPHLCCLIVHLGLSFLYILFFSIQSTCIKDVNFFVVF